jgi:sulfur relay (sulfurtransferase) complex TusBCD TusD component (DsrE family)
VIDDIGGIYGYLGDSTPVAPGPLKTIRIRGNNVRNGIGATYGTTGTGAFANSAYAYYWDNTFGNIYADSNHASNGGRAAVYFHYLTHDITMRANTFYNSQYLVYVVRDATQDITNNIFKDNILWTKTGTQKNYWFDNFKSTARATFGTIDSNHIVWLNTNTTPFVVHSTAGTTSYTYPTWKAIFDAHSDTLTNASTSTIREDYALATDNTVPLGSYNWLDARRTFYAKNVTYKPYKTGVLRRWQLIGLTPPTVSLSYSGSTQTPGNITLNASASDADGVITQVEFFQNGVSINTDVLSPYSFNVTGLTAGSYTFIAKATDNDGQVTTSAPVTVTVSNPLPVVSITSPPAGQTYTEPATVVIAVTATITSGTISRVDFYSGGVFIGTDNSSPYSYTWNSVAAGVYSLTAVGVSSYGDSTTSPAKSITVNGANIPPSVSLTAPTNGSSSTTTVYTVTATASDADGTITNVKFYDNGTLIQTELAAPYTSSETFSIGTHTIIATATDNDGAVSTSAPITITVLAPNIFPAVSITSPQNDTSYYAPATINITGTASDADGTITNTKLYQDGLLVASDNTSPYEFTLSSQPTGGYIFILRAFDDNGDSTSSSPLHITVVTEPASQDPDSLSASVQIVEPVLCAGGNATVNVSASGGTPFSDGSYIGDYGTHTETAGLKTYIVEDSLGVKDTVIIAVNEPAAFSASSTVGTIQVYLGATTAIINPIGGTAPYQYQVNSGAWQTSNTFTLPAGTWFVNVKDANNCTASTAFTITQPAPDCKNCIIKDHGHKHVLIQSGQ